MPVITSYFTDPIVNVDFWQNSSFIPANTSCPSAAVTTMVNEGDISRLTTTLNVRGLRSPK